uniref:Uncharacterized protein n=1 Tax=Medicago truncatula TaxID=3880 RepID=I3SMS8_MEDTR|nr:unknown [Medicago truncatula]
MLKVKPIPGTLVLVRDFISMLRKRNGRIGACMTMLSRNCQNF